MEIGLLIQNLIEIKREADKIGLDKDYLSKMQIVEISSEQTIISRSIKLELAKDNSGQYHILKTDYDTHYDNVMKNLGK